MPVDLTIDGLDDLEQIGEALGATERIYQDAMLATIKRTQRWLRGRVIKTIAVANDLPPKAVKARVMINRPTKRKLKARIWVGLNAIAAARAGKPTGARPGSNRKTTGRRGRRTGSGVKVGKHRFPHAWITDRGSVVQRKGRARFPIETVTIEIAEKGYRALRAKPWPDGGEYFTEEFERQIRFRMERAARRAS